MAKSQSRSTSHAATRTLAAIGAGAILVYGSRALLNFFGRDMAYSILHPAHGALDSEEFLRFITTVTHGNLRSCALERLKNGDEFYPAELEAIRRARQSINLEFYEFSEGEVSSEMLAALEERARAGVEVRLIVDRIGSWSTHDSYFNGLRSAGGRMCWYHPLRWDTWQHANQRTHRKLLVVDAETGFLGGAGVADHWLQATASGPRWRDTVFRIEGTSVIGLVSTFSENWLECTGEILSGSSQFSVRPVTQCRSAASACRSSRPGRRSITRWSAPSACRAAAIC
jgi:cardiolipin synthase